MKTYREGAARTPKKAHARQAPGAEFKQHKRKNYSTHSSGLRHIRFYMAQLQFQRVRP